MFELILIGYGMHAAAFSLRATLALSRHELMPVLEVDTLQNIAVTLFVIELLAMAMRTPPRFIAAVSVLGAFLVMIAPWAETYDVFPGVHDAHGAPERIRQLACRARRTRVDLAAERATVGER